MNVYASMTYSTTFPICSIFLALKSTSHRTIHFGTIRDVTKHKANHVILPIMCFQLDTHSLQVNLVRPMYPHHQQKYSSSLSLFSWQKLAADVMEVFHVYI